MGGKLRGPNLDVYLRGPSKGLPSSWEGDTTPPPWSPLSATPKGHP